MICNRGLVDGLGRSQLVKLFSQFGTLENVVMLPFKSYCFVSYFNVDDAKKALNNINGKKNALFDHQLVYLIYTESVPKNVEIIYDLPPGLEIIDNFITDKQEIFLLNFLNERWINSSCMKNRQVKHYGYEFDYDNNGVKQNSYCDPIPKEFEFVLNIITLKLNWYPNQITINRYLPGQGIPSHIDTRGVFDDYILSLSLGSDVVMEYKNDMKHCSILLKSKSLLIMSGECRNYWTHGITPRKFDIINTSNGPDVFQRENRTSITFRRVILNRNNIKNKQNLYQILECDKTSSHETIKENYRRLILQVHPDKTVIQSSNTECAQLNVAWNILKNPKLKKEYDEEIEQNEIDTQVTIFESLQLQDLEKNIDDGTLFYRCRCGGIYFVPTSEIINISSPKPILFPCDDCSLFIELNLPEHITFS
ncbi:alkylated DNA repair protein alkB homolog 8-like isoform X2 [Daktulosphaira vitifoliae]|nr:alkylated DNA repair protein alkB homolog 8-like isoform X2 [Daktulosphaira vitifoliae]